ncbi:two-component system sensor histidine kinase NtrB [Thermodesulforhabdus norvegica]|uniref:histidine kinase n=1 Tax=Thermodesulforhabdus norvegica TaxID=39841 RepID=A0A1I4W8L1_9BACT|nr:ATP-binding protein [Thermodesulforhabdus norvegica]SFN10021.1 PAS fold-containing protein [Thermodesulforhabdus norvegica]
MKPVPTLQDIIGIEYSKLGFFREAQERITQLRTYAEELARKKQQIQAILDAITDVMLVLDLNYRIVSANNVYFKVFDHPFPIGRYCFEALRKRREPCNLCPATKALHNNSVQRQEDLIETLDGPKHLEITASPIKDGSGKPCHILLLKRDVTVEREYRRKCYEAEKMATIGLLASGVAHEINNPLTGIYGFSQALKRRLQNNRHKIPVDFAEDVELTLNIILEECRRCQDIIQSLLTYSRESPTTFTLVNLNELVQESLKLLKHRLAGNKKRRLTLNLDPHPTFIKGNPQQLKQLILNLVLNAIDATSDGGHIKISTRICRTDSVELEVDDDGCGIPDEHMSRIFDPFFTTKPVGQGTGMGLAICYNIAQNHGAYIKVHSQEGRGSKFIVVFPESKR